MTLLTRPCSFTLVRHGETDWNAIGRMQGHSNIDLNKRGKQQAYQLKEQLRHQSFSHAFSSDLRRAQETASILIENRSIPLKTHMDLRELSAGFLEGKTPDLYPPEYFEKLKIMRTLNQKDYLTYKLFPDMESPLEGHSRAMGYLHKIAAQHAGESLLIVSHGGIMRCILQYYSFHKGKKWFINNCGGFSMQIESSGVSILNLFDTHLVEI